MALSHALRATRSHGIALNASAAEVFPLFTPQGERLWVAGWDPQFVYPPSGATEAGMVFLTHHPHHPTSTVWTVATYDPSRFSVSYVRMAPDHHVASIDVACRATGATSAHAQVSYTLTGLSEVGNRYVESWTEAYFQTYLATWQTAINAYLGGRQHAPAH